MTTFVLNLSKHYNDLSVTLPFLYDLMANQQLYLTKTSGYQLLPRINEGLQDIKTQLSLTFSHQWRLVVLVEVTENQNPYTTSLYAKCLAIQNQLQNLLKNSAMRPPKDIMMLWLDSDNDEFIRYNKDSFLGQTIRFDYNGHVASTDQPSFFSSSFFQEIDQIWKKAHIDTKGQNIEDLSLHLSTKVQETLSAIQHRVNQLLENLPEDHFLVEQRLNIFPKAHLQSIRQAVEEEFSHTQNNPKEWNSFQPSTRIKQILKQKNSLFALPIRQKFTFLRLSIHQVLPDLIKLALILRLLILHDEKIMVSLRKEQMPLWKNLELNQDRLATILYDYLQGLQSAKLEMEQLKVEKSQLKVRLKQYKAPAFTPADTSELPDFTIHPFRFSWFNHIQTLPDFLNWLAHLDQKLHQHRDAAPKIIEKCHLLNTQKKQEVYPEEWNELDSKQQLKELQQRYDKAQQILNNALQHPPIFQQWENKKAEKELMARDQFGKRPSKRIFFVSLLLAITAIALPFIFGWYEEQHVLIGWSIGIAVVLLMGAAGWILYHIVQPLKELVKTLVETAKDTKKDLQLELKAQEYYIENIIQSAVLRKNIEQLKDEIKNIQHQKQLLEYHIKEADYHIELVHNLVRQLKLKPTTTTEHQNLNLHAVQLNQAFSKNSFSWIFDYLKQKEKLDVNISNTPLRLAESDQLGALVKTLNFQEDRMI